MRTPSKTMRAGLLAVVLVLSCHGLARAQSDDIAALNANVVKLRDAGKYSEAIPLAERSLALTRAQKGEEHADTASRMDALGTLYLHQGRYAEAEPLYERALTIFEKTLGPEHQDVGFSLNNLAAILYLQGRYADAEPLYKRSLAIDERTRGPEDPAVGSDLNNLAMLYGSQGRYAEAEPLYKRALAITRKALGAEHRLVAVSLANLAGNYEALGRDDDAESLRKSALAIAEKALGPRHPDVGSHVNNLAALYVGQGRYAEAEPLYKRAIAIDEKALELDHPAVGTSLNNLASLYREQGRYSEAEPLMKRALAIRQKAFGAEHPLLASSYSAFAGLYEKQGRKQDAEKFYLRALAIEEKALGTGHANVARTRRALGGLYKSEGRYAEAERLLSSALAIDESVFGADHRFVAGSLTQLADLHRLEGRTEEAERLFQRALAIRKVEIREVPVLFGTDRQQDRTLKSVAFSGERAEELAFGEAVVLVPKPEPAEALERKRIAKASAAGGAPQNDPPTEMTRLTIRNVELLPADRLTELAQRSLARSFRQHVFVFVHGYNVSFENALLRTAQIAYDMNFDSAAFLFTWPSRSSLLGYGYDDASAQVAVDHLEEFLRNVVAATKATKVHLVAHSMGNVVLLNALAQMKLGADSGRGLNLGEIILHAPDVDVDRFRQLAKKIRGLGAPITLYSSTSDRALGLSQLLRGLMPRAGGSTVTVGGVETIDVTAAGSSFLGFNHDIYATNAAIFHDMRLIMESGTHPPDKRSGAFQAEVTRQGTHWVYRPGERATP